MANVYWCKPKVEVIKNAGVLANTPGSRVSGFARLGRPGQVYWNRPLISPHVEFSVGVAPKPPTFT